MPAAKTPTLTKSITAIAPIAIYQPVSTAGAVPAAGESCLGFATQPAAVGDLVPIDVDGSTVGIAGAVIAFGNSLQIGTAGTLVPKTTGRIVGRALNSAAVGDQVEVLLDVELPESVSLGTNPLTGGDAISLLSGGKTIQRFSANSLTPYNIGFFGDSRANSFNNTQVECIGSGTLFTQYRTPTWVLAHMKDGRYVQSYAVSGGQASDWNNPARAAGRTVAVMNASNLDAVFVQFGVNDITTGGATAATVALSLQRLCLEIMKGGKHCVFEAINPVPASFAGSATYQPVIDQANAIMQSWLASFPMQAVFSDTASALKGPDGYGLPAHYEVGGVHFTRLGAFVAGKKLSEDCRVLLPKRNGAFFGGDATAPNLISQTPGFPTNTQFGVAAVGTGSVVQSSGQDSAGVYYEWVFTPATLASGHFQGRGELSVNFQTALPPAYSVSVGEIVEGTAILVVDDGNGGPSSAFNVELRERFYTGSTFNDWGGLVGAAPAVIDSILPEAINIRAHTPRMQITAASVVANPSSAGGLQLQVLVETATLGQPIRVRMYNPQIRRVGYVTTPLSVTPPASASAYTNTSAGDQQVTIGGGTVTAIAINGVATGLVAGSFVLSKGDTLTPTYSAAPTMTVKQF